MISVWHTYPSSLHNVYESTSVTRNNEHTTSATFNCRAGRHPDSCPIPEKMYSVFDNSCPLQMDSLRFF